MLGEMFANVPVELTNSVVAHAIFHRCRTENYPFSGAHLFVFVGQGVAGAWMDDPIEDDALDPVELGHMVFGADGPRCRCGHHGCVEAYTSLPALAELLRVTEAEDTAIHRKEAVPVLDAFIGIRRGWWRACLCCGRRSAASAAS